MCIFQRIRIRGFFFFFVETRALSDVQKKAPSKRKKHALSWLYYIVHDENDEGKKSGEKQRNYVDGGDGGETPSL